MLQELSKRNKCLSNIIVHGLSESSSLLADRVSDDTRLLSEFLKPLLRSLPTNFKLFWLDCLNERGTRSLKIILLSCSILSILVNFNIALKSCDSNAPKFPLFITRDRTVLEFSHIRHVYSNLAEHKNKWEANMVKYVNGVPLIVTDDQCTRFLCQPN